MVGSKRCIKRLLCIQANNSFIETTHETHTELERHLLVKNTTQYKIQSNMTYLKELEIVIIIVVPIYRFCSGDAPSLLWAL